MIKSLAQINKEFMDELNANNASASGALAQTETELSSAASVDTAEPVIEPVIEPALRSFSFLKKDITLKKDISIKPESEPAAEARAEPPEILKKPVTPPFILRENPPELTAEPAPERPPAARTRTDPLARLLKPAEAPPPPSPQDIRNTPEASPVKPHTYLYDTATAGQPPRAGEPDRPELKAPEKETKWTSIKPQEITREKPQEITQETKKSKKSVAGRISDVIFYSAIAAILLATLVFSGKSGHALHIFGYSAFSVLSGSMQREIPQGSLVIDEQVDPKSIKVGDDVTYIRQDNTTVTHRVVAILENYQDSGARGFQTKGLENPMPDPDIVSAINIVGVVKYSVPGLGFTLEYISGHIGYAILLLIGIAVSAIAIKKFISESVKDKRRKSTHPLINIM